MNLSFNLMQTVGFAIMVYYIGKFLRHKVYFFQKFCVPAPVIGGFLFAIIRFLLQIGGIATFEFDQKSIYDGILYCYWCWGRP